MSRIIIMHKLLTACSVQSRCQSVHCAHADERSPRTLNLRYCGIDHIPHCRARAAARAHRVLQRSRSSWTSNLPSGYDKEQTSHLASLEARWPAGQASRNAQRFTPFARECLSMATLVCAHSTTILTNHELVEERIFCALQVRTRTMDYVRKLSLWRNIISRHI